MGGGENGGGSEGGQNSGTTRPGSGQRPNAAGANATPGQRPQGAGSATNPQVNSQPGMQGRTGSNAADPKVMHDTLKLTTDQIKTFDDIEQKYRTKMRTMMEEIRANGTSRE